MEPEEHKNYINQYKLIGLPVDDAYNLLKENGEMFRIVREDRTIYTVTMDLNFDRYNLEIDSGIITKVYKG